MGHLKAKVDPQALVVVDRRVLRAERLVYILASPRPEKYAEGKSRILYIGTTKVGTSRVVSSLTEKASEALLEWGIKTVSAYVVKFKVRKNVRTWEKVEKALLALFRARYFEYPKYNRNGSKRWMPWMEKLFKRTQLEEIIQHFAP